MKEFKIICTECEREVKIKGTANNKDIEKQGFDIYLTTSDTIVIECKCGNAIWIG